MACRACRFGGAGGAVDPQTNGLMLAPGENLMESHRHHSHTMSIHPFGLLTVEGSDRDRTFNCWDEVNIAKSPAP